MDTTTATIAPFDSKACNIAPNGSVIPDKFGLNIGNNFAGIPANLVINLILFAILLAIFVILRKRRWGSSRIPLMGRRTNDWTSIFYGNRALELSESGTRVVGVDSQSALTNNGKLSDESPDGYDVGMIPMDTSPQTPDALSFTQWIKNALLARDDFLLERSGPAAVEYLRFQRHVIAFTALLCIISVGIILPVNFRGDLQSLMTSSFPKTTINNVDVKGDLLWVHVAFTMILFPMALLVMLSYGLKFGLTNKRRKMVKTLMFYGLNPRVTTEERIRKHFEEAYPECQVTAIYLTLDVAKLEQLDLELTDVLAALKFYDKTQLESTDRPVVKDVMCGFFCGCCVNGVDAVDYYQKKRADLERKIQEEVASWKKTNPVFFVTFANEEQAYRVYTDFRVHFRKKPKTSVSAVISAGQWTARLAPSPSFVSWENLSTSGLWWWIRALAINSVLVLFLVFISTPAVALNLLSSQQLGFFGEWFKLLQGLPLVSGFLPSLLLLTIAGLIPVLIYYTVRWTGYHTRSKEMRAEMKLLFTFLLLAILILPSLALTRCAFLPDNGALFVNLMLVYGFLSSGIQLLRLGQLFLFFCRYFCGSKSEAERHILLRTKTEFPFNEHYPDILLRFTVVVVYSFVCPVVTPFGLSALCMKYLIDRYNLSYVYGKTEAPTSVHASAVNMFLVGILMQNFLMLFFFVIRGGLSPMSSILIAVLVMNCLIYIGISWFGLLKKVSLADEFTEDDIDTPRESPTSSPARRARSTYIPPVLQRFEARHMSPVSNSVTSSIMSA